MNQGTRLTNLVDFTRKELLIILQRKIDMYALFLRQLVQKKASFDDEDVVMIPEYNKCLHMDNILSLDKNALISIFEVVENELENMQEIHNAWDKSITWTHRRDLKKQFFVWIKLIRYIEERIILKSILFSKALL